MNRSRAQEILDCLRVSGRPCASFARLHALGREWGPALEWLDLSGLALYFWRRLEGCGAEGALPPEVRARLSGNLRDNGQRLTEMAQEFGLVNRCFEEAGAEYAVLKGFALIPEYCPDALLRTQYDYDYFLRPEDLERVQEALAAAGYVRKERKEDHSVVFFKPTRQPGYPSCGDDLYSSRLYRSVELHFKLWDKGQEKIDPAPPEDFLARTHLRSWNGLRFRVLADEDELVFQVLHAFRHILHNWCRLSNFLEIAYFLERRSSDREFWERFFGRVEGRPRLLKAIGVVFSLAGGLFGPEIPPAISDWTKPDLSPALALWVERYGRQSALDNFSRNKFSLFLHREFIDDPVAWREVRRRRLFPIQWPRRPAQSSSSGSFSRFDSGWKQGIYFLRRLRFHLGAALRYAWERPRWARLLRRATTPPAVTRPWRAARPAAIPAPREDTGRGAGG